MTTKQVLSTRVHFRWAVDSFEFGDQVKVVGNCESLGHWDPLHGLNLYSTDDTFPCFCTREPIIVPSRVSIEYKYIVLKPDGTIRQWQSQPNNRVVSPTGLDMTVEDDGGLFRSKTLGVAGPEHQIKSPEISTLMRGISSEDNFFIRHAAVRALDGGEAVRDPTEIVYVVSMLLPVVVAKDTHGNWSVSPNKAATIPTLYQLRGERANLRMCFIGWPGLVVHDYREQQALRQLLLSHDCIPVFLPEPELLKFQDFCGSVLWPACHGVLAFDPRSFDPRAWAGFQWVNQKYGETVISVAREDADIVWVHDYHVSLVPLFVSRRLPRLTISFFLHTPFPIVEVHKTLPVRDELLKAMLCADIIGFQFFEYARHFLTSCRRLLGLDHTFGQGGQLSVDYCGRRVKIRVSNACIEPRLSVERQLNPMVHSRAAELKSEFHGKFIFAGIDRCDRLAGLLLKMRAMQNFLEEFPDYKSQVVLVQLAFPPRLAPAAESLLAQEAESLALSINRDAGCEVVKIICGEVDHVEKLALLSVADCLLETSLKDGLNLTPFDYLTCRTTGVVICSEFAGCARVLTGAIKINPWNTTEVARALRAAVSMTAKERNERFNTDQAYVSSKSLLAWADDLIEDTRRARKSDDKVYFSLGFGSQSRVLGIDQRQEHLNIDAVIRAYKNSKNRLILLDNEGTLAAEAHPVRLGDMDDLHAHGSPPNLDVLDCLKSLAADSSQNLVVITSGRPKRLLADWFSSAANVGLAAEHGFYLKVPLLTGETWSCLLPLSGIDLSWMTPSFELMRHYTRRTQGSFIENKGSALVWQFRDADPELGHRQAVELTAALEDLLAGGSFGVNVTAGKGYVEVKLDGVNKGAAALNILGKLSNFRGPPDFVLCVGDDRSDEFMFEAVNAAFPTAQPPALVEVKRMNSAENMGSIGKKPTKFMSLQDLGLIGGDEDSSDPNDSSAMGDSPIVERKTAPDVFTVKVGRKQSHAKYFLEDVEEVTRLMHALRRAAQETPKKLTMGVVNSIRTMGVSPSKWRPLGDSVFREGDEQ